MSPQPPRRDGHWGPSRPLPSRPGGAPRPAFPATNIVKGASGGGGGSNGGGRKSGALGCGAIAIPAVLATLGLGAAMALPACQAGAS